MRERGPPKQRCPRRCGHTGWGAEQTEQAGNLVSTATVYIRKAPLSILNSPTAPEIASCNLGNANIPPADDLRALNQAYNTAKLRGDWHTALEFAAMIHAAEIERRNRLLHQALEMLESYQTNVEQRIERLEAAHGIGGAE